MSIPSIAMIPSGYKANKVYSVLPTDGSGDLDSARTTTARRINQNGLIEEAAIDVPRLDYTDGGCPSLLLEPASTNLITYSEDFSDASWTKLGSGTGTTSVITPTYAISPDGTQNASRLQCDLNGGGGSSANQSLMYDIITGVGDTSASIYVKSNTGSNQTFYFGNSLNDYENGEATTEWQRLEVNWDASGNGRTISVGLRGATNSDDSLDLLIYGGQVEALPYATSYIPTAGTTITRTADSASKSGISSLINSSEGVFYAEIENTFPSPTTRGWNLQSSLNNGSDLIAIRFSTSQSIVFYLRANGVTTINQTVVNSYSGFIKIALKYKSGDSSFWINGVKVSLSATAFSFGNPLSILGSYDGLGGVGHFSLKDSRVYKTALSDAELTTLTTP